MKLWDKGSKTDQKIDQFTVGNDRELDLVLAFYDVRASKAHAQMLFEKGLLTEIENKSLQVALDEIGAEIETGSFTIENEFEDIHSKIEYLLIQKLGETGKKIHTARSRNDQVLTAIHLFIKEEIENFRQEVSDLCRQLLVLAEEHKDVLLPGYTHFQIAMPSSFGLWFSAYAESLIDDLSSLEAAYYVADQNPLGSAAGYGSSFDIDRERTTGILGFRNLKYNVVAAQMSRGKVEKCLAFALGAVGSTLSRMAMDICLYMSQNFNFISFPDELTTGSSIMPHKKNPDVFELIRAKCNRLEGLQVQMSLVTSNLPSGYHRDLQVIKELLIPACSELHACLDMMQYSLQSIQVRKDILKDEIYDHLFSVEAVNELVKSGMPFRDAYKKVAESIADGSYVVPESLRHTHEGSIGNLCLDDIRAKLEFKESSWS